jgi:hypothetical protein
MTRPLRPLRPLRPHHPHHPPARGSHDDVTSSWSGTRTCPGGPLGHRYAVALGLALADPG